MRFTHRCIPGGRQKYDGGICVVVFSINPKMFRNISYYRSHRHSFDDSQKHTLWLVGIYLRNHTVELCYTASSNRYPLYITYRYCSIYIQKHYISITYNSLPISLSIVDLLRPCTLPRRCSQCLQRHWTR